jgi:TolA-binding protein
MIKILGILLLAAASAFAAASGTDAESSAQHELRRGILAHIDGNDRAALEHFAACRKLADPKSDDSNSCAIYEEMFGKEKAKDDGSSKPEARKVYKAAVAAYKKGDLIAADKGWHHCLELSVVATAVENDCLAAIDLIPKKRAQPGEAAARAVYMDGLAFYEQGLKEKAAAAWTRCAKEAPRGSGVEQDCRVGLEKLKAP